MNALSISLNDNDSKCYRVQCYSVIRCVSVCNMAVTVWLYIILAVGLIFIVLLSAAIFIVWYLYTVHSSLHITYSTYTYMMHY